MRLISVIIPAYNAEKTIKQTIDSVLTQTYENLELIIIDDGSKDKTLEIIKGIDDKRIKVCSYMNSGVSTARNRGLLISNGDFISFIDSDDTWTRDKLELQVKALEDNPEAGAAYCWTLIVDQKGSFLGKMCPTYEGYVYQELFLSYFASSASNLMFRKECFSSIGLFDTRLGSCEDWDYSLRISLQYPFVCVPKFNFIYLKHSNSMSSNVENMEKNILRVTDKAINLAPIELQFLKKFSLSKSYLYLTELCLRTRETRKYTLRNLKKSLFLKPNIILTIWCQKIIFFTICRLFSNSIYNRIYIIFLHIRHFLIKLTNKDIREVMLDINNRNNRS